MYECYYTVCGSTVCIFVLKLFVLCPLLFVVLQSIPYYLFYFCVIVLYVFPFHFVCSVIYIVSPFAYCCSFPFVFKFKDHSFWMETQLQSVNIVLYHIISSGEIMPNIMLWWLGYLFLFLWRSLKEIFIWFFLVCLSILQNSILKKVMVTFASFPVHCPESSCFLKRNSFLLKKTN